jgi:N-acetylneuraminic acid mutarotase
MKSPTTKLLPALVCLLLATVVNVVQAAEEPAPSPLPAPVSNNAVAITHGQGGSKIYSFMGIGPKKTWDAVSTSAYEMDVATGKWKEIRPVPGVAGRLAASAVAVHDRVFIFGGYVIDSQGGENTVSDLDIFVPAENRYYRGRDIPVPVQDAVAGVYRDRYVFLIGGWSTAESGSKGGAVRNVQVYDTEKNTWLEATPIPGTPVFGHAGAILGDTIVYVDGAYKNPYGNPKFPASRECWMGKLTKRGDPTKIEWTNLPVHPGNARFRIAAGAGQSEKKDPRIYFAGGSDTAYDYNGIGYSGRPAEPSPVTFAFNVYSEQWETVEENTPEPALQPTMGQPALGQPTMDHRALLVTHGGNLVIVGGMEKNQQVTSQVTLVRLAPAK